MGSKAHHNDGGRARIPPCPPPVPPAVIVYGCPKTLTGTVLLLKVPLPNWPYWLFPQQ